MVLCYSAEVDFHLLSEDTRYQPFHLLGLRTNFPSWGFFRTRAVDETGHRVRGVLPSSSRSWCSLSVGSLSPTERTLWGKPTCNAIRRLAVRRTVSVRRLESSGGCSTCGKCSCFWRMPPPPHAARYSSSRLITSSKDKESRNEKEEKDPNKLSAGWLLFRSGHFFPPTDFKQKPISDESINVSSIFKELLCFSSLLLFLLILSSNTHPPHQSGWGFFRAARRSSDTKAAYQNMQVCFHRPPVLMKEALGPQSESSCRTEVQIWGSSLIYYQQAHTRGGLSFLKTTKYENGGGSTRMKKWFWI